MTAKRRFAAIVMVVVLSGCAWLTGDDDDVAPEKLYADKPCPTECCCKTKRGYYAYFRCLDRATCDQHGGSCERADLARCAGSQH